MSTAAAARLIKSSEEERRRLARELHDDIGQRLALLADDADRLRGEVVWMNEEHCQRLEALVQQLYLLSEDLRRISHTLHPAIVEELGLLVALRSLTDDFATRTGLAAIFVAPNPPTVPTETATVLYRILQEALRNIAKHAGDTPVRVSLYGAAGEAQLTIADLGSGFDPGRSSGLGLISMRERAQLAGGALTITSAPGQGTTIQVRLPIAECPAS